MLGRLLVGFDGSADARAALRMAVGLASVAGAEVVVVAVVSRSRGETDEDRQVAFEQDAVPLRQQAETAAAESGTRGAMVAVEVLPGDHPARVLHQQAQHGGYDLIVVGRHGRRQAVHGGLGRVARDLVERPGPAVLVVSAAGTGRA